MNEITNLVSIILTIARALILAAGGGVGLYKIVKGKADENPRDFNEGVIIFCGTGVLIALTYAVQGIFK